MGESFCPNCGFSHQVEEASFVWECPECGEGMSPIDKRSKGEQLIEAFVKAADEEERSGLGGYVPVSLMRSSLFQLGDFKLNSGKPSKWKLECDAFTDGDIETLAYLISQMVGPFGSVEGVPRGGLRLMMHLTPYCQPVYSSAPAPHLIVDDVLTTGGSMEREKLGYELNSMRPPNPFGVIGAVVFARGLCPHWIKPLFQMPECLWVNK